MSFDKSKVSIVVACKNEGMGLENILHSVKDYADEIIIVDGHSKDGTEEIANQFKARFFLDNKKGRGDALKIGIANAKNEIIVFFDADGSHETADIPSLVEPILQKRAEMVIGSRIAGGCLDVDFSSIGGIVRVCGANFMVYLVNRRFKETLTEILYSFRAIRTDTARNLNFKADDFAIEQDMVVRCLKNGCKVMEVPSREKARAWGKSKLKTSTGFKLLFNLVRDLYFG